MTEDAARPFLERVRAELTQAMKDGANDRVSTLRMLVAAVDNAQAVPLEGAMTASVFGSDGVEPSRRSLTPAELDAVLLREVEARRAEAETLRRAGRVGAATAPDAEADTFESYRQAHDTSADDFVAVLPIFLG